MLIFIIIDRFGRELADQWLKGRFGRDSSSQLVRGRYGGDQSSEQSDSSDKQLVRGRYGGDQWLKGRFGREVDDKVNSKENNMIDAVKNDDKKSLKVENNEQKSM